MHAPGILTNMEIMNLKPSRAPCMCGILTLPTACHKSVRSAPVAESPIGK